MKYEFTDHAIKQFVFRSRQMGVARIKNPEKTMQKLLNMAGEDILSRHRLTFILVVGFGLAAFLLVLFKLLLGVYSETLARTIVFNTLIVSHMGISLLVRGNGIFKQNKLLVGGIIVTLLLQIIISFTPFFQSFFHLGF